MTGIDIFTYIFIVAVGLFICIGLPYAIIREKQAKLYKENIEFREKHIEKITKTKNAATEKRLRQKFCSVLN